VSACNSKLITLVVSGNEDQNYTIKRDISDLQATKIAIRLEFGSTKEPSKIVEMERVLRELEASIFRLISELKSLKNAAKQFNSELEQLQSAYNSFGCTTLRNISG